MRNFESHDSSFPLQIWEVSDFKFRTGYQLTSHCFLQPNLLVARTNNQIRPIRNVCTWRPSKFWDDIRGRLVIGYRRFRTKYQTFEDGKRLFIGYRYFGISSEMSVTDIYIYMFQNVFLPCPTPRLHRFLSSHWPSFRFLSFMAFLITSIQFFFGFPRVLYCFGIHFSGILGNLPSAILWT